MNPLIAIAANLFPEIMKAIAGDRAQKVAATVSKVVADAVGTDDPVQAERTLAQDPAVAAQLRTDLARIALEETRLRLDAEQRQRETAVSELKVRTDADQSRRQTGLDRHRADLEDTSGARGMQRALASSQSGVAWVAPALSLVVTVGFFLMLLLFIIAKNRLESGPPPVIPDGLSVQSLTPDQIRAFSPARSDFVLQIINICVGALATAFATVMSFWLGSSQSSRVKDQLVSEMQTERATQTSKILTEAANVMTGAGAPHPPEAPASRPAPSPPSPPSPASGETGTGTPVKPAPPGLLAEVVPDLIKPHRHFPTAVSWALTADGIAVDGAAAQGTAGQPTTVRKIWQTYGDRCTAAARRYGVPVELIVATIATESGGDSNARRPEPKIGDESVGLMQTLVATARGATGRSSLRGDDLLDPDTSIDAGTAYIAQQRGNTHFDPPLVAAAYNAGSLRRDEGEANRWKLLCYPRGTGLHIDKFIGWFSDCMRVSRADGWAKDRSVPSFAAELKGAAPAAVPAAAAPAAAPAAAAPALDPTAPGFPPRPSFGALLKTEDKQRLFGAFEFQPDPKPDNPEHVRIMGDWAQTNIVRVSIPVKRFLGRDGPLTFEFHRLAAEQLVEMWLEWEKEGLLDHIVTFDGSYVPRFMRGSRTKLSNHAFGTAFDINAQFNALGAEPARMRERGCVRELVPIANKYGFFWGGHFQGRSDGMHFEVARLL
jgi:D-alanyl-D-alanine carboxypeptidase/Transglycosylase SLT domain